MMFGFHSTKPTSYTVNDWLRGQEERARNELQERVRLTTLAMRAARWGLDSLSMEDRHDLVCFTGFDINKFYELMAQERP